MRIPQKVYAAKAGLLVRQRSQLHSAFAVNAPVGPELYFHLRCLHYWGQMRRGVVVRGHAECLYALLTAWGMNSRKARLEPFGLFYASLRANSALIEDLRDVDLRKATQVHWQKLKTVWDAMVVTNNQSAYQLVGRAKLLAHLMPNWIAPVDRAHTLEFLSGSPSIPAKQDDQWELFRAIHEWCYAPVARRIGQDLAFWVKSASAYGWDSSIPKTIDNLIWGTLIKKPKKKRK